MANLLNPLRQNLSKDLYAGLIVGLLAMPLCIAIASASSFPPAAGLITAIVAGLIASFLSGAPLSIKGPAAGLIVIVAGGVADLGGGSQGYRAMLAVGFMAGLFQLLAGWRKAAKYADAVPPAVIHGMLAGIGIIIFTKQLPILFGLNKEQISTEHWFTNLPLLLSHANLFSTCLGLFSILLLAFAMHPKIRLLTKIPAPLLVLGFGLIASICFDVSHDHTLNLFGLTDIYLGPQLLVHVPDRIWSAMVFPDFSALMIPDAWLYVFLLSIIGSIESTVTVHAIDHAIFPNPPADVNKDLFAIGVANSISSLVGGLPMISEIARSKANVDYGAKTGASNFFHGIFILGAVVFIPQVINLIPLSVLAAILLIVAYRLASPHEYLKAMRIGYEQLAVFVVTAVLTVSVDILVGMLAGIALKLMLHLFHGGHVLDFFKLRAETEETDRKLVISMRGPAVFSNFIGLRKMIAKAVNVEKSVELDFRHATLVDHTTMMKLTIMGANNKSLTITGLDSLMSRSQHELSQKRRVDHVEQ